MNAIEEIGSRTAASSVADQFVTFICGGVTYGVEIMLVQEIRSWQPTSKLPSRLSASRGVLDIRGKVVEVFDLGVLLGGAPLEAGHGNVVLVMSLEHAVVGLLVEAVCDIMQAEARELLGAPDRQWSASGRQEISNMLNSHDSLVALLNVQTLFSHNRTN